MNRRLYGFVPGNQAYAIPVNSVRVLSGSRNVTVAPGVGGLFTTVGPLNPHQYYPNALWAQDWIYEGLVSYGQGGEIVPALATSWAKEPLGDGERYTFSLRQGVEFHDGTPWNCDAAKLNLDHVLSDIVKQRHSWFGAVQYLTSWTCNGDFELVMDLSKPFYPFLQELTYIRPLRFASPSAFAQGQDSHPDFHNSCESGKFGSKWDFLEEDVTCLGLSAPVGTGALKYVGREAAADGSDAKVIFEKNNNYWGQVPDFDFLTAVQYESTADVESALMTGELDMALGIGPLEPEQVQNLKNYHSSEFDVKMSDVVQHSLIVFNSNKAPTDDIIVRQAIIHSIDKNKFLEEEFAGLESPVTQLLPESAPYCNVDLWPKWGYDPEKAKLLNCPDDPVYINVETVTEIEKIKEIEKDLGPGGVAGVCIAAAVGVGLLFLVCRMIQREKQGKPMFAPNTEAQMS